MAKEPKQIERACARIILHMMVLTMEDPASRYYIALNFV